jgi:DNA-binding response OmpR family regulator
MDASPLPSEASAARAPQPDESTTQRRPAAASGAPRVAVLESDGETRTLLIEVLKDAGFIVVAAAHPSALPEWWRGDVIVTDTFEMPYHLGGAESVVRSLRARHHAPVVIVSGHSEVKVDAVELGADAVLIKPFDIDELVTTIRRVSGAPASPDA